MEHLLIKYKERAEAAEEALERILRIEDKTHESFRWDLVKAIVNNALKKIREA